MKRVLPEILSDSNLIDWPAPTVNVSVVLNIKFSSVPCVLLSAVENPLIPVRPDPSPVIVPPVTSIPDLAVITPIESTFVTSSYVSVPPIPISPGVVYLL